MKHLVILLSLLTGLAASAQPVSVTYSEPFEKANSIRTFQCDNGNTLVLKYTNKEGRTMDVYDKSRKVITHAQCNYQLFPSEDDESVAEKGMYQIGGDVVEFTAAISNDEKSLYRIIYSSETGKIIREDKIATMPKHGRQRIFGVVNAGLSSRFQVVVDSSSKAYAVFSYDDRGDDAAKRIELIHFSNEHKEIGRGFYDGSTINFGLLNYIGMVVRGTDDVILLMYGYKNSIFTCNGTQLLLSKFKGNAFEHHIVPGCRFLQSPSFVSFTQNVKTNRLDLLTVYETARTQVGLSESTRVTYDCKLAFIDPSNFSVAGESRLDARLASQYRKTQYGVKRDLSGIPTSQQNNPDGSSTLIMQEMSAGSFSYRGDIGLVDFDADGKATNGVAIRYYASSAMDGAYHAIRILGSPADRFVVFNDHPANFLSDPKEDPKLLISVGAANAVCYRIKDGHISKSYLFGEPDKSFDNRYADVRSDNYSAALKTYAVPMVERSGHQISYRMAWIQIPQ